MITLLGSPRRGCCGPTRRDILKAGSLALAGGVLPGRTAGEGAIAESANADRSRATPRVKSVILLYLQGGPPTQDMFDLKPSAPPDIRGEFRPIDSSVPGVQVGELLPLTSKWMHTAAVVRGTFHHGGCHKNLPMYTGFDVNLPDEEFRESDPPSMGSVCSFLQRDARHELPVYAYLPCPLGWGEVRKKAGPHAGFLGSQFDPFSTTCNAYVDHPPDDIWNPQILRGEPSLTDADLLDGITLDRLNGRRTLVEKFDEQTRRLELLRASGEFPAQKEFAFEMLSSAKIREAFDLSLESHDTRSRYGRTLFGATALLARRLVERGVQFVNVSWDNFSKRFDVSKAAWDTHENNFPMLKTLLPSFDQTYSALIEDLSTSGLLDETLVVTMGEMGRTPKINAKGGRDHWTFCYSVVLAGAGIKGGMLCGASDSSAAYVKDRPVHIKEICATIYHLLGIDPGLVVHDRAGRPVAIAHGGAPVREVLA